MTEKIFSGLTKDELIHYTSVIIPDLERKLTVLDGDELVETYELYLEVLKLVAVDDFDTFNKYLEIDEDKRDPNKSFYHHRRHAIAPIAKALNDIEVFDLYDMLLISTPPRVGKTTLGIRFLAWIVGRYPEETQLATSYSEAITRSFYIGELEVICNQRYKEIFPEAPLVNQNAKSLELWLKTVKRYPSISFIPINGSMTGKSEASKYLYLDDLVSNIEEAMSPVRLEKLWQTYSVNAKQRKKQGAKEVMISTRWSVNDPITKLEYLYESDPRVLSIKIPCFNEDGESNFDFFGGFDTKYYENQRNSMDEISFNALYMQEPIEREGLLYHKEDMQYYFELPEETPDSIIAICDSKNMGTDYVCSPVGYVYGDFIYIEDVVYNNGLPDITRPAVANSWTKNGVVMGLVEMNNGGEYYAEDLQELLKQNGARTSVRTFFSSNNKMVKIITYSDFVKKHFIFKHQSTYSHNSEYSKFIRDVFSFTQTGKNKHDDSVDGLAMLAQFTQDLSGNAVKILDRRRIGL